MGEYWKDIPFKEENIYVTVRLLPNYQTFFSGNYLRRGAVVRQTVVLRTS